MTTQAGEDYATLRKQALNGSILMVLLRWSVRLLGLGSTIVLARLLTPEAFGIAAIAVMLMGLIEVLTQSGQQYALIRGQSLTREHYDTAWTIQVLLNSGFGVVAIIAATALPLIFGPDAPVLLAQVLCLSIIITGFENIGTVAFRKDMDFGREFKFRIVQKVAAVAVALTLAVLYRNEWALIGGTVAGQLASVIVSYAVHPFRPRFCLAKRREIWGYSWWILLSHIALYVQSRAEMLVVSLVAGPAVLGRYSVASDLASAPTAEVVIPVERALFSFYSRIAGNLQSLANAFLKTLSAVAIVAASSAAGMYAVAADLVPLLLGDAWTEAVLLIEILALSYGVYAVGRTVYLVYYAMGESRRTAVVIWRRNLVLVPIIAAGGWLYGVEGVLIGGLLAQLILLPVQLLEAMRRLEIAGARILAVLLRPVLAAAAMLTVLALIRPEILALPEFARLLVQAPLGAAIYGAVLLLAWRLGGRPTGAEAEIEAALRRILKRLLPGLLPRRQRPAG